MSNNNEWYISRDNKEYGPFSTGQLKEFAQSGHLLPADYLRREGTQQWAVAERFKGLFTPAPTPGHDNLQPQAHTNVGLVDLRPILPRNETNCISKVEAVREQIYHYFVEACRAEQVEALVIRTEPFQTPVGLHFQCWVPHRRTQDLRDRSYVSIYIEPREFHQYAYVISIDMQDNNKIRCYRGVVNFTANQARAIVRHLLRRSGSLRPALGLTRLRVYWFQLWRPRNKLLRLRFDFLPILRYPLLFLGVFLLFIFFFGGILLILASVGVRIYCTFFRRSYCISSGKPSQEPRRMGMLGGSMSTLIPLDSWQTVVPNLGPYAEQVRAELDHELKSAKKEWIVLSEERIWHWGVDGIEERRQIVGRLRRGMAFVHVYGYGDDLFVGWDAHVNAGDWKEKEVASGVDRQTGELCRIFTIESGRSTTGEYDVFDSVCLAEWVHLAATKVVKRTIKKHNIDHEVDYTIHRGDRQKALEQSQSTSEKQGGGLLGKVARGVARGLGFRREG